MRQYRTKTIFMAGHRQIAPGRVILLDEQDAEIHVLQGTIEAVKDPETIRRELLWIDLKAAANKGDLDGVIAAVEGLMPTPATKPAPDPAAPTAKTRG